MIQSIKHKGLLRLYETGSVAGIQASHKQRLRIQLTALDTAHCIEDLQLPGFGLHKLKGEKRGLWSITVNKNWRLTFEFTNGDVHLLNYEDYH